MLSDTSVKSNIPACTPVPPGARNRRGTWATARVHSDGIQVKINAEGALCHKNQGEARARVKGHASMREASTMLNPKP